MPTHESNNADVTARLEQLLLTIGEPPPVVVSHDRLMEASTKYLVRAQQSAIAQEQAVANRILESEKNFHRWENSHAALMRRIANERASAAQRAVLLSSALALIHRKALFGYLRDHRLRGQERLRLLAHFYGSSDYVSAVVLEHGNYLRSAASYLCSSRVGSELMLDGVFDAPLLEYESLYESYFNTYCDAAIVGDNRLALTTPLLQLMKQQVYDWRNALLALAHSRSGTWRGPSFPKPPRSK
jgi:hypothetical protein